MHNGRAKFRRTTAGKRKSINGDLLGQYRAERNMSMNELADILGVSLSAVWSWEVGGVFPRREGLLKLEKLLGRSIVINK